ncbi:MAG: hypothetical protein LBJ84_06725 [Oscillospiraceae bacterium]|jgi:hypothetical protein|nr:hypothetical protein [Oscillospiraceae bacterium]
MLNAESNRIEYKREVDKGDKLERIERMLQRRQANSLSVAASSRQKLTFEQLHIYYSGHGLKLNDRFEDNLDLRNGDGADKKALPL